MRQGGHLTGRIKVRRVVTGHDEHGKAVVSLDGDPPHIITSAIPGEFFTEVWKTFSSPATIDSGKDTTLGPRKLSPHAMGSVVRLVQIPPESGKPMDDEARKAHFASLGSPEASTGSGHSRHPLMHRTETIDYGVVLEGEITLLLDDSEVDLKPGDIVVQRGTNHAWSNRSDKPCRILFVLLDGAYTPETKAALKGR
jgi:mannose-6-phosphate isomerase-like protein (cupin superfamily)